MENGPAPTHDLIRLRDPYVLAKDAPVWVDTALQRTPWVVVRCGNVRDGVIPVGIRGNTREERYAALLSVAEIVDRRSPEDLFQTRLFQKETHCDNRPALAALEHVAPILDRWKLRGGPGGSVGFEIATGSRTVTDSSDLDLIIRMQRRFVREEAVDLLAALSKAASPVRIDVIVETPVGGVLLADLVAMPKKVLVRTADGPRLSADPWSEQDCAVLETTR